MEKYFSANGGLGLKALWNQFYSDRSDGKTFDIVYRGLKRFQKGNYITVYMRRWKTEFTQLMIQTFLDDVLHKKAEEMTWIKEVKCDKSGVQIKKRGEKIWRYAFYFTPLTVSNRLKSNFNPELIREIDFDEYVPLDNRYAPNEMINLLEFWNTCDRQRGIVKLCTFGNRITGSNPFLSFFNIDIKIDDKYKTRLYKNGQLMIQIYHNEYRREVMSKNPIMQLVEGTIYENYMKGGTLDGGSAILRDKPDDTVLWSAYKTELGEGTIWLKNDIVYISDKINYSSKIIIADKPYIVKDNDVYVASLNGISTFIKNCYRNSRLYSTSFKAWENFQPIMKLVSLK